MIGSGSTTIIPVTATPSAAPAATQAISSTKLVLEDFESGALSGWAIFKDAASSINPSIISPGGTGTYAMRVGYSISSGGYGGVQRGFDFVNLRARLRQIVQFAVQFYRGLVRELSGIAASGQSGDGALPIRADKR